MSEVASRAEGVSGVLRDVEGVRECFEEVRDILKEQQGDIDQVEIGAREAREVAEKAGEDIEKAKSYGGGGCSAM